MRRYIIIFIILLISCGLFFATTGDSSSWGTRVFELSLIVISLSLTAFLNGVIQNIKYWKIILQIIVRGKINNYIRVSFSYLYRISYKDEKGVEQYLLVRNSHMDPPAYQPVGGVYKYYDRSFLDKIGARDAKLFHEKNDFRLEIKGRSVHKLIRHFDSQKDREVDHFREFHEELLVPGILKKKDFPWVNTKFVEQRNSGFRYSEHFKCWEVNFYNILEIEFTPQQKKKMVKDLQKSLKQGSDFILVPQNLIEGKGMDPNSNRDLYKINEHTRHIINRN